MTIGELKKVLAKYDDNLNIYVPLVKPMSTVTTLLGPSIQQYSHSTGATFVLLEGHSIFLNPVVKLNDLTPMKKGN